MNSNELKFLRDLLDSTQVDNIIIIPDTLDDTLASKFKVCGKHAAQYVEAGFYVFEMADWPELITLSPSAVYPIKNHDIDCLFYFAPFF